MNAVNAVLLAFVLIAVVLLVVWLVLRSRSSDPAQGAASSPEAWASVRTAEGGVDDTPRDAPTLGDRSGAEAGSHADVAALRDENDSAVQGHDVDDTVAAEEFVDPGLSGFEASESASQEEDGTLTGTPPRTPAEAFGPAHASADLADHEAASRETSVLDDPDVDSTPLFRSIREELLGSPGEPEEPADSTAPQAGEPSDASGDTTQDEPSVPAEDAASGPTEGEQGAPAEDVASATPEEALTHDVVAEQPALDLERTWSEERRDWDEQTHAETTGPESESDGPVAEEEEPVETTHESAVQVVDAESGETAGGYPPIRRISELQEVVDGGFGIGSAALISDGAQPLGHPIKANVDTKTYQDLHSPWYDETEPDVWFLDAGFAERAGFHRAE